MGPQNERRSRDLVRMQWGEPQHCFHKVFLGFYGFPTGHARTQTHISKKRLTLVGKYSHAASEVALLRTPLFTFIAVAVAKRSALNNARATSVAVADAEAEPA